MSTLSTGGLKTHNFTQSSASNTWVVNHGLGTKPSVDVMVMLNGVAQKAFPLDIEHVSDNIVRITWTSPQSGFARLTTT